MPALTTNAAGLKHADLPRYISDGAAHITLRAMQRYFEDPAVKADYKKWLKSRKAKGVKE
jgi:hypothetical protein